MSKIIIERISDNAKIPEKQHFLDVGYDLRSIHDETLGPGQIKLMKTGLKIGLPKNLEAQVRPRSGLASEGLTVVNSPGTIDSGYRGEVCVLLINLSNEVKKISNGQRIAQLVFSNIERPEIVTGKVEKTSRNENGFGSTGIS